MEKNSSSLVIVGSLAFDSIKTPFGKIDRALGGSASYFGLAARGFCALSIVGVVGEDFGSDEEKVLADKGIDVSGVDHKPGKTFAWGGEYSFDLNNRTTLFTDLNVLADFKPKLSSTHKKAEYLFLGNTHPSIQLDVLSQMESAGRRTKFVGLDTMNYWIESALPELKNILGKVDCLIINDSEARELSGEHNLLKGAKGIMGLMGKNATLIIKRGEYGLLMFRCVPSSPPGRGQGEGLKLSIFHLPGFPLEDVTDPTGAGDSFAGGLMGFLAKTDDLTFENLKRACVYGSVMASFCCEKLGTERLQSVTADEIAARYQNFKELTHFELI